MSANAAKVPLSPNVHGYSVIQAHCVSDRETILGIWRAAETNLSWRDNARSRYDWAHIENIAGHSSICLLQHERAAGPVGAIAANPRNFTFRDQTLRAAVLTDLIVMPGHRTAFPALLLQREARAQSVQCGDLIYGLPSASAAALSRRLPAHVSQEVLQFVRVLRSRKYLRRHMPQWLAAIAAPLADKLDASWLRARSSVGSLRGSWLQDFDERFDGLWAEFDRSVMAVGVRDRRFLQWRFTSQPKHAYEIFAITSKTSQRLKMYFVCEVSHERMNIKDCLTIANRAQTAQGLMLLIAAARSQGMQSLTIDVAGNDELLGALSDTHFSVRSKRPFFAELSPSAFNQYGALRFYITQADEDI